MFTLKLSACHDHILGNKELQRTKQLQHFYTTSLYTTQMTTTKVDIVPYESSYVSKPEPKQKHFS